MPRIRPAALALLAWLPAASAAAERSFVLTIGAAPAGEPARFLAQAGDAVTIELRSAIAGEAHLHGYNLAATLAPGGTASWRFVARATGRYPLHIHRAGESPHRHGPPAAYLEVRPR